MERAGTLLVAANAGQAWPKAELTSEGAMHNGPSHSAALANAEETHQAIFTGCRPGQKPKVGGKRGRSMRPMAFHHTMSNNFASIENRPQPGQCRVDHPDITDASTRGRDANVTAKHKARRRCAPWARATLEHQRRPSPLHRRRAG